MGYAIYTLQDIDLEPAHAELKYARPLMERYVKNTRAGIFSQRKKTILEKALEKVN